VVLAQLLFRARISTWDQWTWFRDAELVRQTLLVPDKELAATIARCYLPMLRTVMPDLQIVVCADLVQTVFKRATDRGRDGYRPVRQRDLFDEPPKD